MRIMLFQYEFTTDQMTAIISEEQEIKVILDHKNNTMSVLKKSDVLISNRVSPEFADKWFVDYCKDVAKTYGL